MTTIAYRDGVLAADGRAMYGGCVESDSFVKVLATARGSLVAVCGNTAIVLAYARDLIDDVPEGKRSEIGKEDGRVIEVRPDRSVWIHEHGGSYSLGKPKYRAWGSGSDAALGALAMGANAKDAIRAVIRSKADTYTGGKIRSVSL